MECRIILRSGAGCVINELVNMSSIVDFLLYFGIEREKVTPLIVLFIFIVLFINWRLSPIDKIIKRISNSIIEIQTLLKGQGVNLSHLLIEAPGSPLRPTRHGALLIRESGLEDVLDSKSEALKRKIKRIIGEDYTEYDVQEAAREVLISLKDTSELNNVKVYAYKNGINVTTILHVGRLWLRDDFLGQPREVASI